MNQINPSRPSRQSHSAILEGVFLLPRREGHRSSAVAKWFSPSLLGPYSLHDSSIQHECYFQIHAIQGDLAVVDHHMLLLHPSRFDAVYGFGCPGNPVLNGIFETLRRFGTNLDDLGYGHGTPPFLCANARFMTN